MALKITAWNADDPSGVTVQDPAQDVIKSHERIEIDEKAEETFTLRQVAGIVEMDLFQCMKAAVEKDDFVRPLSVLLRI